MSEDLMISVAILLAALGSFMLGLAIGFAEGAIAVSRIVKRVR